MIKSNDLIQAGSFVVSSGLFLLFLFSACLLLKIPQAYSTCCEDQYPSPPVYVDYPPTVSLSYSPEQPSVGETVSFHATAVDPEGDPLTYRWTLDGNTQGASGPSVQWPDPEQGTHTVRVVVSDGLGGYASDQVTFTVFQPYVVAPGFQEGEGEPWGFVDRVYINGKEMTGADHTDLFSGSQIKTGPGVEVVIRTSFGAVMRVKENSRYEVSEQKNAGTSAQKIVGRLLEGIGEFYWPKGYEGTKRFEVDTDRAVTSIKGTTFSVAHDNDVTTVSVTEGTVEVTNIDTGEISLVRAGESRSIARPKIAADIKINGSDGPLVIEGGTDSIGVSVSISNDGVINEVDWWLVAETPFGTWFYLYGPNDWTSDWTPAYQGALFPLNPVEILDIPASILPEGDYTMYFGIDTIKDGQVSWDHLFYDSVDFKIE